MDTQTLPLVPFGKYKGQPITTLMNDTEYLEWCKQNEWFKKYPIVYNICVNQIITTNQTSKTPEHNKLQILFLENKMNTIKLLRRCIFNKNDSIPKKRCYDFRVTCEGIFNWDIIVEDIEIWKCHCDDTDIECHCDGFADKSYKSYNDIYIEIKTLIGEDYPAIKRKMDTQITLTKNKYFNKDDKSYIYKAYYVLLIKEFNATSATKERLIKYFDSSKIKVVFIDELFNSLPSETNKFVEEICEIKTFQTNLVSEKH